MPSTDSGWTSQSIALQWLDVFLTAQVGTLSKTFRPEDWANWSEPITARDWRSLQCETPSSLGWQTCSLPMTPQFSASRRGPRQTLTSLAWALDVADSTYGLCTCWASPTCWQTHLAAGSSCCNRGDKVFAMNVDVVEDHFWPGPDSDKQNVRW